MVTEDNREKPQWEQLVTWQGLEPDTSSTKSGTLSLHHSARYEGRTLRCCNMFGFPIPIAKTRKNWFQQPKDQKISYLWFWIRISEHPPPLPSPYCALCLARSSRQRVNNASIGPGVRKEKIYTWSWWEILRHSTSGKVDMLYNFMTEKKYIYAWLPMEQHVMFQNYTSCERGRGRVVERNTMSHTSETKSSLIC